MKYSVMDLGSLGGGGTAACGINDLGQVVGKSNTVNVQTHAFRTAPNSPINLATDDLGALFPGGLITQAIDINDSDQVVGKSGNRAFIYTEGMMYDLNDLISYDNPLSLQLGWVELSEANTINNKGRIVYEGFSYSSLSGFKPEVSSFLLTPIPGSPFKDVSDRYAVSVRILLGIIGGGGGLYILPGGGLVPVPPPELFLKSLSPEMQGILVGLALYEMSSLVNNPSARKDIQKAALNLASKEIQQLIKSLTRG